MSNMEVRGVPAPAENFELIEQAVMESPRGRWFLAEYGARVRIRETSDLTERIKSLEVMLAANHDAIMSRIATALGQPAAAPPSAPTPELAPHHMKFFKRDEEIFEAAPQAEVAIVKPAPEPEEKRGAKLTIRRIGAAEAAAPAAEPVPVPEPAPEPDVAEQQRRRIVIIRHKPGDMVTVPLQEELAKAS